MFKKSKIAIVAIAAMLAMCVGLTACGGSSSSSSAASSSAASSSAASSSAASSSAASSSAAASSAASSSAESNEVIYWVGTLSDGATLAYIDDAESSMAAFAVIKSDLSDAKVWVGSTTTADGVTTLTDSESKEATTYTISDVTPTTMKITIDGYGTVDMEAVTSADFKELAAGIATIGSEGQKLLKSMEAEAEKLAKEIADGAEQLANEIANMDDSTIFFWNGTLADGSSVSYMDDPDTKEAILVVAKPDFSDGAAWYGKYTTGQDGKTTLTDTDNKSSVTYEIVETNPGTSMKMNIEWLGEAELKPVTKGDFAKLAEELSKLASDDTAK